VTATTASAASTIQPVQRSELSAKYGLDDDIAQEAVSGWDDLDLEDGMGGGGKAKREKKEKKRGLGAVMMVDDD